MDKASRTAMRDPRGEVAQLGKSMIVWMKSGGTCCVAGEAILMAVMRRMSEMIKLEEQTRSNSGSISCPLSMFRMHIGYTI